MTPDTSHIPVRKRDIGLGKPLPWAVYDGHGNLVLNRGCIVETETQFEALTESGLYRERHAGDESSRSRRDGQDTGDSGAVEHAAERAASLDEIKLAIGDFFQIQAQVEQAENRYYVRLIGYLKGKSVLVTVPEADGRLCLVREGQAFVVRFFAGKNAYAFTANVLRSSNIPFPHMHLSYPSQVRGLVVRTGERVPVRIICAVAVQDGTKTVAAAGLLTNLSVSGAMLSSKSRLGPAVDQVSRRYQGDRVPGIDRCQDPFGVPNGVGRTSAWYPVRRSA
jgi:c-di-GMP-binding flagellar brake protein YcgR